ncbi:hypothetical protein, partial [Pseudomonas putida]|uniref:hypothetical protein n=1 Tax=Pseudomonas putida TaxID=303 RepID=UPI001C2D9E70
ERLTGARHNTFCAYEIERRPRGASRRKAAPTFVSGQLLLPPPHSHPWVYGWRLQRSGGATFDIEWNTQGVARQWHRLDWPETDVGAALRRDAPRGRRSISQALKDPSRTLLNPQGEHPPLITCL